MNLLKKYKYQDKRLKLKVSDHFRFRSKGWLGFEFLESDADEILAQLLGDGSALKQDRVSFFFFKCLKSLSLPEGPRWDHDRQR